MASSSIQIFVHSLMIIIINTSTEDYYLHTSAYSINYCIQCGFNLAAAGLFNYIKKLIGNLHDLNSTRESINLIKSATWIFLHVIFNWWNCLLFLLCI